MTSPPPKKQKQLKSIYEKGWCKEEQFTKYHFSQQLHKTHVQNARKILKQEQWIISIPLTYLPPDQITKLSSTIFYKIQSKKKTINLLK